MAEPRKQIKRSSSNIGAFLVDKNLLNDCFFSEDEKYSQVEFPKANQTKPNFKWTKIVTQERNKRKQRKQRNFL